MTTRDLFDVSDAYPCPDCGYQIHPALHAAAHVNREVAKLRTDYEVTWPEADTCWRCAYTTEKHRTEILAGLLRRRHALDPLEVAEALADIE